MRINTQQTFLAAMLRTMSKLLAEEGCDCPQELAEEVSLLLANAADKLEGRQSVPTVADDGCGGITEVRDEKKNF